MFTEDTSCLVLKTSQVLTRCHNEVIGGYSDENYITKMMIGFEESRTTVTANFGTHKDHSKEWHKAKQKSNKIFDPCKNVYNRKQ